LKKLQQIFAVVAVETLVGVETGGVWGGGAQEVKIDLMPPRVPKVSIIFLFWNFLAASSGRPQSLPSSVSFYLK
jgi:hypothetical protein